MRLRLILAFALVIFAAIASVLFITRQSAATEVRTFMARGGMMGVDSLADELEGFYLANHSWQGVDVVLESTQMGHGMGQGMMMGNGPWLRVADAQGKVVADNRGDPAGSLSQTERGAAVALHDPGGQVIGYLAASGNGVASEQNLLNSLTQAGWIAAGIAGVLALLLALLFSYTLARPVGELTQAAAKMASGDLSQRVQPRGGAELATLGSAFNTMAESLQKAEQNRRAMTADIAHELRTPIAIQRAHLEALEDGIYPLTVENLRPVLEQTGLLTRLVEDLRTLALADAGELRLERAPTDLPALVRRVVNRFAPEAESHGVKLSHTEAGDHSLHAVNLDSGRVEQILNNLISNGLRYTPEGGALRVELTCADSFAVLEVSDTGPGIPPDALPHLFERFYRADQSRSREGGGTGLGLAIAQQLALAHGGDLSAANRPEGGARFVLRLPLI